MKIEKNKWGGEDFTGPHGVARETKDADGERNVLVFSGGMMLRWSASFSSGAPNSAFMETLARAQKEVGVL